MERLPRLDRILDRCRPRLRLDGGIDAVLIVEIDAIGPRRFSESSTTRRMRSGRLSNPFVPSILKPNFVAMATVSRTGARASANSSWLIDKDQTSTMSKNVTPRSVGIANHRIPWARSTPGP